MAFNMLAFIFIYVFLLLKNVETSARVTQNDLKPDQQKLQQQYRTPYRKINHEVCKE